MNNDNEMEQVDIEETDVLEEETSPRTKRNYFGWWTGADLQTRISIARLTLIPFIMFFYIGALSFTSEFFVMYGKLVALILFIVAVISIGVDDFLFRKSSETRDKWFDNLVTKLLLVAVLILVAVDTDLRDDFDNKMPAFAAILVLFVFIARELAVAVMKQRLLAKGLTPPSCQMSKIKAIFYFVAITLFMVYAVDYAHNNQLIPLGAVTIYQYIAWSVMVVASAINIISAVNYGIKYQKLTKEEE